MVLRLTDEEMELMKTSLLDSVRSIRQEERVHCGGASCAGIELCQKRLLLEALLESVEEQRVETSARAASGDRVKTMPVRRMAWSDTPELVA